MAGIVYTKLLDALKGIGIDVSQQQTSNVQRLIPKNKSTATKPGLLAAERDRGGNFATVLDVFRDEAKYIDSMNDAEQMAFLNNILDYNEFGGKSIRTTEGIKALDEFKKLTDDSENLQTDVDQLLALSKKIKDEAEAGKKKALEDLDVFIQTGGQPLKKKDEKFLGGSMHEEGQLRTGIREFLKTEYKNGRLKLNDLDKERIMQYSPMIEHDPILVFKRIYGDEAYKKAGTFPGAFEVGRDFKHYEEIFRENMGEDLLKVKNKEYVGDGRLVLTDEVYEPKPDVDDDDIPFAEGGRASFASGKLVSEIIAAIVKKEPIEAMKEVNKVIGKKGKYKNLTKEDINKIVEGTDDWIMQRDPDNLYVYDDGKTIYDDDLTKEQLIEKESRAMDKADEMSLEDSLTTTEGLGATQTAERFKLKNKYPGITDDLLDKILADNNPQRKAEVLATIDEAFKMMEKGKGTEEIIETFKNMKRTKNAKGGRAGFYLGGQSGQSVIEPDLSDIGHGSDALMSRTRMLGPNTQATTSTGLNYLLGEDNDNTRIPFNDGLLVPPSKPYTLNQFDKDSMMLLQGIYGTGKATHPMLFNSIIDKGNKLRKQGVERETIIEIIRKNKDKINAFLKTQTETPKTFEGIDKFEMKANGGRIGFETGLLAENKDLDREIKKMANIYTENETVEEQAGKELEKKLKTFIPTETKKEKEERELFQMVKEFQKFKRINPDSGMTFNRFLKEKKKEKELIKNKIVQLDLKYPEKEIINKKTNMVDTEKLKEAIDAAELDLELSPVDGLLLKRTINTEGEQSVTSGSFSLDNLTFTSPNLEEGKLTTTGQFNIGDLNVTGTLDTKDSDVLRTGVDFNYNDLIKGKFSESDGYKSGSLDLNQTFPINDKFKIGFEGGSDLTISPEGQTSYSSTLTPKFSYQDGIFNADISKEIMEGGGAPNLNIGASFPLLPKTYKGDLILNDKGKPIFDEYGYALRNPDYTEDLGIVTIKGGDLLSKNRYGTIGLQKDFGNKDDGLFFTAGGEKNIFDDGYTIGAGLKYRYADGGIAGLRPGYAGGTLVDKGRRGFLKLLGVTAGGVAALKTGLVKLLGKDSGAVSKKVIDEVIVDGSTGAPSWLQPLVNKALREGTDKTKNLAYKDAQTVKRLDTPTGNVDVYYDVRTGEVEIDYIGGNTALGESVQMRYTPGIADEGTGAGGRPADEFEATEAIPEGKRTGPDDFDIEMGENTVGDVKGLYSDTSELAELVGQKPLIKDISETIKKKKVLKQMDKDPAQFVTDVQGDYVPD